MPQQHVFVALYVGDTVKTARPIAANAEPSLVKYVCNHLLQADKAERSRTRKRRALRIVAGKEEQR